MKHGYDVCVFLPLLHALSGCDTTSRIFGIGKSGILKLFIKNPVFRQHCNDFLIKENLTDISRVGEQLLIALYDEKFIGDLNVLRYQKFASKVASSSTCVQVHTLPPTAAAAHFHTLRAYYQAKVWMGDTSLNPLDYGWYICHEKMAPVKTSLAPAPDQLLKIIRCNCKLNCDSKKCTCRKHGLECSNGCGNCKGISCSNSPTFTDLHDLIDEV